MDNGATQVLFQTVSKHPLRMFGNSLLHHLETNVTPFASELSA